MRQILSKKNYTWLDITQPSEDDIKYLKQTFSIHPLTANTIIPSIHYPDLDQFKNYLFIILHYPHLAENGEIKIREFDFIAGKKWIITSRQEEISLIDQIFESYHKPDTRRADYMNSAPYILFLILNTFMKDVLSKVNDIVKEIDMVESRLFTSPTRQMLAEISNLKMKVLDFWRIVEPQKMIFESLRASGVNFYGQEYRHYFVILHRAHRRIENTLKNAKETIEALEETNHILVTVKTNEVIRVLTVFSVIFMPLTLIASIWGMNTNFLPFHNTPMDFLLIMVLMLAVLIGMLMYFRRQKWI